MRDSQIQTLAKQLVASIAPMIQSMAELSELKRIGKESSTDFFTHRDFQTWMRQRGVSLSNGHGEGDQFL
jgi:hypothetical protein